MNKTWDARLFYNFYLAKLGHRQAKTNPSLRHKKFIETYQKTDSDWTGGYGFIVDQPLFRSNWWKSGWTTIPLRLSIPHVCWRWIITWLWFDFRKLWANDCSLVLYVTWMNWWIVTVLYLSLFLLTLHQNSVNDNTITDAIWNSHCSTDCWCSMNIPSQPSLT